MLADCILGGVCSYVMIVDNYAVLQTIHEQLRCVEFADSVAVEVCSYVVIMFISAVLQKICALQHGVVFADLFWDVLAAMLSS